MSTWSLHLHGRCHWGFCWPRSSFSQSRHCWRCSKESCWSLLWVQYSYWCITFACLCHMEKIAFDATLFVLSSNFVWFLKSLFEQCIHIYILAILFCLYLYCMMNLSKFLSLMQLRSALYYMYALRYGKHILNLHHCSKVWGW